MFPDGGIIRPPNWSDVRREAAHPQTFGATNATRHTANMGTL